MRVCACWANVWGSNGSFFASFEGSDLVSLSFVSAWMVAF